jgi:hypothetical protein
MFTSSEVSKNEFENVGNLGFLPENGEHSKYTY